MKRKLEFRVHNLRLECSMDEKVPSGIIFIERDEGDIERGDLLYFEPIN